MESNNDAAFTITTEAFEAGMDTINAEIVAATAAADDDAMASWVTAGENS